MTVHVPETTSDLLRETFEVTAAGLGRYNIQVSIPPEYAGGDTRYPAMYVLDGNVFFETVHGWVNGTGSPMAQLMPRAVVIGIGYPADEGDASYYARRNHDFYGPWDMTDQVGQTLQGIFTQMKEAEGKPELTMSAGGGPRFMAFLRDELYPALADRYPIAPDARHVLIGHSSGGHFVLRAMFDPASPFRRYVCMSPAFGCAAGSIERLEAEYAAAHDDLDIEAYLCAGSVETDHLGYALCRFVSGMTWVREQFAIRGYPSARVTAEIQPGEYHGLNFAYGLARGLSFLFHQNETLQTVLDAMKTAER
jgi:predicted alpha/beta superfamily hydrolase